MFQGSSPVDCKKRKWGSTLLDRSRIRAQPIENHKHSFSAEFLNRPKPTKTFRISSKLLHIYKGNPSHILKTLKRLVCYSLWDLRDFVLSNYTRIYRIQNYNQALVEYSCYIKIITDGDLKPLSGISKSRARWLVLV